jgi:pilus assembly protein Flp/PilA
MREIAMRRTLRGAWENQAGVTAIEYALLASLIAILIVVGVTSIGGTLSTTFQTIAGKI